LDWKDYNKKDKKIKHTEKPGTIVTYYCSYDSMKAQECMMDEEE